MPESDDVVGDTPRADRGQLDADRKVRDALAAINFDQDHPVYQRFVEVLARGALERMHGMMASGRIFAAIRKIDPRIQLWAPAEWTTDDRAGIADAVVTGAIRRFHCNGLVAGDWNPDAGASMMTYLISICLILFPNEFRSWRSEYAKRNRDESFDKVERAAADDPLESMITMWDFELLLESAGLNEKQRTALKMLLQGHRQDEIAAALGLSSAKAVENLLGRTRKELKRQLGGGEHGTRGA